MIGDCTDGPNIKDTKEKLNQMNNFFYSAFFSDLNPGSLTIINYKIFLTLYTLVNIIYLPLIFSFDLDFSTSFISVNVFNIIIFLVEMLTRFRISYYHMGEIVSDRKKIAMR